jgi:hypothetical protein
MEIGLQPGALTREGVVPGVRGEGPQPGPPDRREIRDPFAIPIGLDVAGSLDVGLANLLGEANRFWAVDVDDLTVRADDQFHCPASTVSSSVTLS